ncbi:hypothetical protein [Bartonella gabonensis]|nr:hypothetical protein [Bartonella gabonensis]
MNNTLGNNTLGKAKGIIAKQRHGATENAPLTFKDYFIRFRTWQIRVIF